MIVSIYIWLFILFIALVSLLNHLAEIKQKKLRNQFEKECPQFAPTRLKWYSDNHQRRFQNWMKKQLMEGKI